MFHTNTEIKWWYILDTCAVHWYYGRAPNSMYNRYFWTHNQTPTNWSYCQLGAHKGLEAFVQRQFFRNLYRFFKFQTQMQQLLREITMYNIDEIWTIACGIAKENKKRTRWFASLFHYSAPSKSRMKLNWKGVRARARAPIQ